MTSPSAARALGEDFLKRTEMMATHNDAPGADTREARRVVTALLDALRPLTELARFAEGDTRPKVTTELTANAEARPALTVERLSDAVDAAWVECEGIETCGTLESAQNRLVRVMEQLRAMRSELSRLAGTTQ